MHVVGCPRQQPPVLFQEQCVLVVVRFGWALPRNNQVWKDCFPKGHTLGTDEWVKKHTAKLTTRHNLILLNDIWKDISQSSAPYIFNWGALYYRLLNRVYLLVTFLCEMPPISKIAVLHCRLLWWIFVFWAHFWTAPFLFVEFSSPCCIVWWDCNLGELPSLSQASGSGLKAGQSHAPHQEFVFWAEKTKGVNSRNAFILPTEGQECFFFLLWNLWTSSKVHLV